MVAAGWEGPPARGERHAHLIGQGAGAASPVRSIESSYFVHACSAVAGCARTGPPAARRNRDPLPLPRRGRGQHPGAVDRPALHHRHRRLLGQARGPQPRWPQGPARPPHRRARPGPGRVGARPPDHRVDQRHVRSRPCPRRDRPRPPRHRGHRSWARPRHAAHVAGPGCPDRDRGEPGRRGRLATGPARPGGRAGRRPTRRVLAGPVPQPRRGRRLHQPRPGARRPTRPGRRPGVLGRYRRPLRRCRSRPAPVQSAPTAGRRRRCRLGDLRAARPRPAHARSRLQHPPHQRRPRRLRRGPLGRTGRCRLGVPGARSDRLRDRRLERRFCRPGRGLGRPQLRARPTDRSRVPRQPTALLRHHLQRRLLPLPRPAARNTRRRPDEIARPTEREVTRWTRCRDLSEETSR